MGWASMAALGGCMAFEVERTRMSLKPPLLVNKAVTDARAPIEELRMEWRRPKAHCTAHALQFAMTWPVISTRVSSRACLTLKIGT